MVKGVVRKVTEGQGVVRKLAEVWLGGGEERPKGWVIGHRDCKDWCQPTYSEQVPHPLLVKCCTHVCGDLQLLQPVNCVQQHGNLKCPCCCNNCTVDYV